MDCSYLIWLLVYKHFIAFLQVLLENVLLYGLKQCLLAYGEILSQWPKDILKFFSMQMMLKLLAKISHTNLSMTHQSLLV